MSNSPAPIQPESDPLIFEASGLRKTYRLGAVTIEALRGVDLVCSRGEFVVVAGPSGCGKTTLFNLLGALDEPDSGSVLFEGSDLGRLTAGGMRVGVIGVGSIGRAIARRLSRAGVPVVTRNSRGPD